MDITNGLTGEITDRRQKLEGSLHNQVILVEQEKIPAKVTVRKTGSRSVTIHYVLDGAFVATSVTNDGIEIPGQYLGGSVIGYFSTSVYIPTTPSAPTCSYSTEGTVGNQIFSRNFQSGTTLSVTRIYTFFISNETAEILFVTT